MHPYHNTVISMGGIGDILSCQNALQQSQLNEQQNIYNPYIDAFYPAPRVHTAKELKTPPKLEIKGENMVTEVVQDTKKFIKDHKSTIYWVALLLFADHFLFNGAFKEKLQNIMQSLIGKMETKLRDMQV